MDNLEIAKALFGTKPTQPNGNQTTTTYGIATSDSVNGSVRVNLGGDTVSMDDDQTIEVETTFAVFEGDEVIVSLVGADGTGKAPCVIGVVGRGDQQQTEINSVINYVWNDANGLHVSTAERSVQGANILLDSDSLDIRNGNSNSESDQTVYASFGREVTVGSRGTIPGQGQGQYSQVYGEQCIANGSYSHAEGYNNTVTGGYSHVEGARNTVGAMYSHAEGMSNVIEAKDGQGIAVSYSHVEGRNNSLTGDSSHVEGWNNTVVGQYHHVEGSNNDVEAGYGNHVEGVYNETNGSLYSVHVEGAHNISSSDYQHVQGKFNVEDANGTYQDIIGNGVSSARSNAYNMDWNGNAEFQGAVYVGGCTPNGETPYPVVRYNTSNSQSEYYNGSSWVQVPGGGGGSAFAYILVTYPVGAACTASCSGTTIAAADTSGTFVFEVPTPGTWTITATSGSSTTSTTVSITSHYQVESATLSFILWLVNGGVTQDGSFTALGMMPNSSSSYTAAAPSITQGTGYITLGMTASSGNRAGIVYLPNSYDLSKYRTVRIVGTARNNSSYYTFNAFDAWTSFGTYQEDNRLIQETITTDTSSYVSVDISVDISSITSSALLGFNFAKSSSYTSQLRLVDFYLEA